MNREKVLSKQAFICDMDGVIYHGDRLLSGARKFVDWLKQEKKKYLFLTNSSERSPRELQRKPSSLRPFATANMKGANMKGTVFLDNT